MNFLGIRGHVREMSGRFPEHFQESSRTFPGNVQDISGKFPGNFQEISRKFPGHFRDISGKFPGHFWEISRTFPERIRKKSRTSDFLINSPRKRYPELSRKSEPPATLRGEASENARSEKFRLNSSTKTTTSHHISH